MAAGRTLVVPNRTALLAALTLRMKPMLSPFAIKLTKVSRERGMRLCDGCSNTGEPWHDFHVIWWKSDAPNEQSQRVCEFVRRAGFETVQLTHAFEGQRFEIIDCRQAGSRSPVKGTVDPRHVTSTSACPPAASRAHLRSAGHDPHIGGSPCDCSKSSAIRTYLNCGACGLRATPNVTRVARIK